MKRNNPIRVAMQVAGGQSKLAMLLGITPQAVRKYERGWDAGRHTVVPAHRAVQIEQAVGLNRHEIRPDLWPAPIERRATPRRRASDLDIPDEAA